LGLHSYDPTGATPGVLWTKAVPDARVEVHLGKGEAAIDFSMELTDWVTVPNSLNPAHPLGSSPATISVHIIWSDITRRVNFSDEDIGFKGHFLEVSKAIVAATARTPAQNYMLVTDAGSTETHFAQIGHDHNGSFFGGGRKID
jgi:hypothetical protein